jgi:hypothetical protein
VISLGNRATVWRICERKLRGEELLRKEEEDAIKAAKVGKRQIVPETETYDQIVVRTHSHRDVHTTIIAYGAFENKPQEKNF